MNDLLHFKDQIELQEESSPQTLTRRESIKWLGVITAGMSMPLLSGCEELIVSGAKLAGDWPDLQLEPITGEGYGTDPNLTEPPDSPWPLTMTSHQRAMASALADILIPSEGEHPAASEVGVVDVLDEWVSAPYPSFQSDRVEILSALVWFDEESERRFGKRFLEVSAQERLDIIDDVAFEEAESQLSFAYISRVFDAMRTLIPIAYFASPQGTKEIGYQGNVPIAGDYPGPTPEAQAHLDGVLKELGLSEYAYQEAESPG